jgi:hypothetical protein
MFGIPSPKNLLVIAGNLSDVRKFPPSPHCSLFYIIKDDSRGSNYFRRSITGDGAHSPRKFACLPCYVTVCKKLRNTSIKLFSNDVIFIPDFVKTGRVIQKPYTQYGVTIHILPFLNDWK